MKIKNIILNIIIAFLCLVFVISSGILVSEVVGYHRNYYPDENSFLYAVQEQDYVRMVDMMHRNLAADVKSNETFEECYAVARYYEAATYFKAYKEAGNDKAAQEKAKIMEEQVLLMGDLTYAAAEIDAKLGIQ